MHSYSFDPWDGERHLVQLTDENRQQLPSGDGSVVRTVSIPNQFGDLRPAQREVVDTKGSGTDSEETDSTLETSDGSGTLGVTKKVREEKRQHADGGWEMVRTTSASDLNGKWEVTERVERMQRIDGNNRTAKQVISRPDYESKLSKVLLTTSSASQSDGLRSETTQTYSQNIPGVAPDGTMHLVERATTLQANKTGTTRTEQQIEQRDPLDGNLKVMVMISSNGAAKSIGSLDTTTTRARGLDGSFSIVSSETKQTNQIPIQVLMTPGDQQSASSQLSGDTVATHNGP